MSAIPELQSTLPSGSDENDMSHEERDETKDKGSDAPSLTVVREQIYALAKAAIGELPDKTLPKYFLHMPCVNKFEERLARLYIRAVKKEKDPIDALRTALQKLADNTDGILSNLFMNYSARLDQHELHNHGSNDIQARYTYVDADGKDHADVLRRYNVEILLSTMAGMLPEFHINKRIGMAGDGEAAIDRTFDDLLKVLDLEDPN